MAEQALVQVRMDKELRDDVAEIYEELGMDIPTAIRMFFVRTKMVRGVPFETKLPEKQMTLREAQKAYDTLRANAADVPEMSLDEINEEIRLARSERKAKKQ